jgi:hypothetical protein
MGCSDTFGVGINYTDTYTYHLSEVLESPTVNLGVPGASCVFQWSNTVRLVKNKVRPKGVIYLWPNITRMMTTTAQFSMVLGKKRMRKNFG